jgi:uncharacterized protein YggT (Ycf19 family)
MGILAGIGGGLGLVILKDQLDDSVKSIDMAKTFGLPVLAIIPRIEDPQLVAIQTRKDRKLYLFAGMYFSIILAVLALEFLGMTSVSNLADKVSRLIQ